MRGGEPLWSLFGKTAVYTWYIPPDLIYPPIARNEGQEGQKKPETAAFNITNRRLAGGGFFTPHPVRGKTRPTPAVGKRNTWE
jgi:hypothetical protein